MSQAGQSPLVLEFLPNPANEEEGLNDSGIETYMDEPYGSVARECGQNSADAAAGSPVRLEFNRTLVPQSDLTAGGVFERTLKSCLARAENRADQKEVEFFNRALQVLADDQIPTLEIADYNTQGLLGPCEPGKPFHSLVKGRGVSTKEQQDSGGSFGIGKNAAYAISELRTVIYSTRYRDDAGGEHFLTQGKSVLTSHEILDQSKLAHGYWGRRGFEPIHGERAAPGWTHREQVGTTIHAIGFREAEDWAERMAATVLVNFVVAIHRGQLEFKIDDGRLSVDPKTLRPLLEDDAIAAAAQSMSLHEDLMHARALLDCLTATETSQTSVRIEGLGPMNIRVLVKEGLPSRLSIVRNGMVITGTMENFGDKFLRFPMYRDFVAMVEPADNNGSALLKRLENPRDDSLSAERIPDPTKRKQAHSAMRNLARQVRSVIRELAVTTPDEVEQIDELAEFFALEDQGGDPDDGTNEKDPERFIYEPKKRTPRRRPPKTEGLSGQGGNAAGSGGSADGVGSGDGDGRRGRGPRLRAIDLWDTRTVIPDPLEPSKRRIWLTPSETSQLRVRIYATALQQSERLLLKGSSEGAIEDGDLEVEGIGGERYSCDITLPDNYAGPIEILGFGQGQGGAKDED